MSIKTEEGTGVSQLKYDLQSWIRVSRVHRCCLYCQLSFLSLRGKRKQALVVELALLLLSVQNGCVGRGLNIEHEHEHFL